MRHFGGDFHTLCKSPKIFYVAAFVLLMEKRGKENASVQKLYTTFYVSSQIQTWKRKYEKGFLCISLLLLCFFYYLSNCFLLLSCNILHALHMQSESLKSFYILTLLYHKTRHLTRESIIAKYAKLVFMYSLRHKIAYYMLQLHLLSKKYYLNFRAQK